MKTGAEWFFIHSCFPFTGMLSAFQRIKESIGSPDPSSDNAESTSLLLQTATFRGHQGRISRPVRAILNGQPEISAGQRGLRPAEQY